VSVFLGSGGCDPKVADSDERLPITRRARRAAIGQPAALRRCPAALVSGFAT
jgi:hypothetical protein